MQKLQVIEDRGNTLSSVPVEEPCIASGANAYTYAQVPAGIISRKHGVEASDAGLTQRQSRSCVFGRPSKCPGTSRRRDVHTLLSCHRGRMKGCDDFSRQEIATPLRSPTRSQGPLPGPLS